MAKPVGIVSIRFTLPTRQDVEAAGRRAIERAALQAVSGIARATAKGVDADGRPFVAYTRAYAKRKQASGRNVVPPDLTLTGTMLRALRVLRIVSSKRAVIGWEGQHVTRRLWNKSFGITRLRQLTQGRVSGLSQGPITQEEAKFLAAANRQRNKDRKEKGQKMASVPYAKLVPALNRKRKFFFIGRALAQKIREVYMASLREGVKQAVSTPRGPTRR